MQRLAQMVNSVSFWGSNQYSEDVLRSISISSKKCIDSRQNRLRNRGIMGVLSSSSLSKTCPKICPSEAEGLPKNQPFG